MYLFICLFIGTQFLFVALAVVDLAVAQADLELTEIHLPVASQVLGSRREPPLPQHEGLVFTKEEGKGRLLSICCYSVAWMKLKWGPWGAPTFPYHPHLPVPREEVGLWPAWSNSTASGWAISQAVR